MENLAEPQLDLMFRSSVTKLVKKHALSWNDIIEIAGVSHEVYEVNNGLFTKCKQTYCLALIFSKLIMYQYNYS